MALAVDREKHLIEVPLVAWLRSTATQLAGNRLSELAAPLSHCLVSGHDSSSVQEILDIAEAKRDAIVKPDGVRDDLWVVANPCRRKQ